MADVLNLQRKVKVEIEPIRAFLDRLKAELPEAAYREFSVALISDRRMKQLNQLFRGKDVTTDVLSFPHDPDDFDPDKASLGDIVISAEQAERQAGGAGLSLEHELEQLILHGLLHLCGMDHEHDEGQMNAREVTLREQLGIS